MVPSAPPWEADHVGTGRQIATLENADAFSLEDDSMMQHQWVDVGETSGLPKLSGIAGEMPHP